MVLGAVTLALIHVDVSFGRRFINYALVLRVPTNASPHAVTSDATHEQDGACSSLHDSHSMRLIVRRFSKGQPESGGC